MIEGKLLELQFELKIKLITIWVLSNLSLVVGGENWVSSNSIEKSIGSLCEKEMEWVENWMSVKLDKQQLPTIPKK